MLLPLKPLKTLYLLNGNLVSEFVQIFGETRFATMCKKRGIELEQIKEQKNIKIPDFRFQKASLVTHHEVKTLSIVSGEYGINADLERALYSQIDLEEQHKQGKNIAISSTEVKPYGDTGDCGQPLTTTINTLIEKTRQNIKPEQYASKNNFLF